MKIIEPVQGKGKKAREKVKAGHGWRTGGGVSVVSAALQCVRACRAGHLLVLPPRRVDYCVCVCVCVFAFTLPPLASTGNKSAAHSPIAGILLITSTLH